MSDLEKVSVTKFMSESNYLNEASGFLSVLLRQFGCSSERVHQRFKGQLSCGDMGHPGRRASHRLCHHTTGNQKMCVCVRERKGRTLSTHVH